MADRFPIIIESNEQQIQELSAGDGLDLTRSGVVNANYVHSAGVNVGVVTATSFIGDGSQITNIPAGGGSLEATASGTLADGSKVIVNADGTVSVVGPVETTGQGAGTPEVFESANTNYISAAFDSTNSKVVIAYEDTGNSGYGTAIVGTVSGTSISFGSPVVFESAIARWTSTTYDSVNQKVVIAYHDDGNQLGKAIVGTVSGTSISFGTAATFQSSESVLISATYDSANEKVIIAYREGSANYGHAVVGTVSGTSISFGTPVVFESALSTAIQATYDSANEKVVISYRDGGNSNYGTAIVGTVSGTSISFGSPTVYNQGNTTSTITFDSANNKVVIAYKDGGNSNYGTVIVGTVSGTSISFGSPVVFNSNGSTTPLATYDSTNQKVVIAYRDAGNSDYGTVIAGTVSGTSISFGTPVVFDSTSSDIRSVKFDSTNGKVVIVYIDNGNSNYGTAAVFSNTGFSIPSVGSATVFESGFSQYVSGTYDSTNNKVVIAYQDQDNSSYGTAVVGTVSGSSITFGTPVVFDSADISGISATFDSSNNKVVIAYMDSGSSDRGEAVVGTVSGTSISFGTPVVFESGGAGVYNPTITFDSNSNKVVIIYALKNNFYGHGIVGTVSGTSISFGSSTTFTNYYFGPYSTVFDSSNNKIVAIGKNESNSTGACYVGTVSGTGISFGSLVTFKNSNLYQISGTFDSSNNKVVIAYRDTTNSNYGTAIVGTVSGTSISFGSAVVFEAAETTRTSATYDSTNNKVVIVYQDEGSSNAATVIRGTISGTSISFDSPILFASTIFAYPSTIYDSGEDRVVIAYRDAGNSSYGTANVFSPVTMGTNLTAENYIGISNGAYTNGQTATIQIAGSVDDAQSSLTPGQQYYVQGDGTLSETADSPSVLAGTAVAATKLMIG